MDRLRDKVAVITGAGHKSGLGYAYALALAAEGCSVVVDDIDESAEAAAQDIRDAGGKGIAVKAVVGSEETAERLVEAAVGAFGRLDILINNAGMAANVPFVELTTAMWEQMTRVHLTGTFLNSQAAVRWMIANGVRGRIINTTSAAGIYGTDGGAHYAAAKGGVIGLTKSNSIELARYGICVNAVAPGALTRDPAEIGQVDEELQNAFALRASRNTLQRFGHPDDVTPLIVFLASDESYYISGQVISATGNPGIA